MALLALLRSQVHETLFAFAGPTSSDEDREDVEPIVFDALVVAAFHGDLPFDRCVRLPRSVPTRSDRLVAVCHLCVEIAQSA
jgi:hypothetical protein